MISEADPAAEGRTAAGGAATKRDQVPKEEKPEKALSPEVLQLQELYELMRIKGLDALELKDEELRVKLTRRFEGSHAGPGAAHHAPARATEILASAAAVAASAAQTIPTPLAGVFYLASSPNSPSFVREGDAVDPGQTLCIVEAMKVMNEIKSETHCRITKILAENGRPVTAGQPLFEFEPV